VKLSNLHEADFTPQLDPKVAKKANITKETDKLKDFPQRSGNQLTPPVGQRNRDMMGIEADNEGGVQKRGRNPSYDSARAKAVEDNFEDAGDVPVDSQKPADDRGPIKRVKGREDISKLGSAYTEKYKPVSFY
jgi:hypothetical protein